MNRFLLMLVQQALKNASPVIVSSIRQMVEEMVQRAAETPNPWDDIIVGLLQMLVGKPGDREGGLEIP